MQPLDLISLGEVLVEFTDVGNGNFQQSVAGDVFNTLYYAQRIGLRTGLVSAVGDDLFGSRIHQVLDAEGIERTYVPTLSGARCGLYFIELDGKGEYTFHYWRKDSAATRVLLNYGIADLLGYISQAPFFLFTGTGLAVLKASERLLTLLRALQGKTTIVFDTNYRTSLWTAPHTFREQMERVLPFVDIFLPSLKDLQQTVPEFSPTLIDPWIKTFGISATVLKQGDEGVTLFTKDGATVYPVPIIKETIDATGAGDAFNAGFLATLANGDSLESACRFGQLVAGKVVGVKGAIDREFHYVGE